MWSICHMICVCILRARGGSSYFGTIVAEMDLYSPRTRR